MSVYVEVVILNNLLLDLLLIIVTLATRRRKTRKLRAAAAAVLGAAAAVGYAVAPEIWQIVIRALLAPILVLIFDKYANFKDYIISLGLFVIYTFCLGGIVYGMSFLIGVDINGYAATGLVAGAAAIGLAAVKTAVNKRAQRAKEIVDVKLSYGGRSVDAKAMCDSGNSLTDTLTGSPVVIVSEKLEKELIGADGKGGSEGFIEVETVNGNGSMPLIKLDSVEVGRRKLQAYGALSGKRFGAYDVILQNTMF